MVYLHLGMDTYTHQIIPITIQLIRNVNGPLSSSRATMYRLTLPTSIWNLTRVAGNLAAAYAFSNVELQNIESCYLFVQHKESF